MGFNKDLPSMQALGYKEIIDYEVDAERRKQ